MGLFRKKQQDQPPPEGAPAPAEAVIPQGPPPGKPSKAKRGVDTADFLALRAELMEVKARLEAAEQAKAVVENRLAALDATTSALTAGDRADIVEIVAKIEELEEKLDQRAATTGAPSASGDRGAVPGPFVPITQENVDLKVKVEELESRLASPELTDEQLAAIEERVAAMLSGNRSSGDGSEPPTEIGEQLARLQTRLDELGARVEEATHAGTPGGEPSGTDPALNDKLDELAARLEALPDHTPQLAVLESQLAAVTARVQQLPDVTGEQPIVPDPDVIERLGSMQHRLSAVDGLSMQLSALNARVTAQAEMGAQLTILRDRINQLQEQIGSPASQHDGAALDDLRSRLDALSASGGVDELRQRIEQQGDITDALRAQLEGLEMRTRANEAIREELAAATPGENTPEGAHDDDLRQAIDDLRGRVEAAEELHSQVDELRATGDALAALRTQVEQLQAGAGEPDYVAAQLDELRARVDQLQAKVSEAASASGSEDALAELRGQLEQLRAGVDAQNELRGHVEELRGQVSALDALRGQVDELAASGGSVPEEVHARLAELEEQAAASRDALAQLGQLAERVNATDSTARQATEQVATLDQRLTSVSTELANQLRELGQDIDALAQQANAEPGAPVGEEVVEALRTGQVRLAKEQARYEIAFREDLAVLAEQLRKGNPTR